VTREPTPSVAADEHERRVERASLKRHLVASRQKIGTEF
jgi:hypothetical protein